MSKIPSPVKEAIQSRFGEIKKELEALKASSPANGDELFDRMRAELKSLQNINNAAGKKLPIRELLSNKQVIAVIAISITIGCAVGWLSAKSLTIFSSYDECILNNIKPGITNQAAGMIRRSCQNIHFRNN